MTLSEKLHDYKKEHCKSIYVDISYQDSYTEEYKNLYTSVYDILKIVLTKKIEDKIEEYLQNNKITILLDQYSLDYEIEEKTNNNIIYNIWRKMFQPNRDINNGVKISYNNNQYNAERIVENALSLFNKNEGFRECIQRY